MVAYEVWRTAANLRAIGKGATLVVDDSEARFWDNRSEELNKLFKFYDERNRLDSVAATGAVFDHLGDEQTANDGDGISSYL